MAISWPVFWSWAMPAASGAAVSLTPRNSRDAHLPLLGWEIIRNPCLDRGIPMLRGVSLSWRVVRICVYINDTVHQSPLVTSVTFSCYAEVQVVSAKSIACLSVQITCACLISSAVRNGGPINVLGVWDLRYAPKLGMLGHRHIPVSLRSTTNQSRKIPASIFPQHTLGDQWKMTARNLFLTNVTGYYICKSFSELPVAVFNLSH